METEPHQPRLERFVDDQITAQHMADASRLFSLHYGVWGPLASTHLGKWARQGKRVQLSPVRLRRECCAELTGRGRGRREREKGGQGRVTDVHNECVRAVVGAEGGGNGGEVEVVGHVLATRWTVPIDSTAAADFSDRDRQPVHVCWITQVVVHAARRRKGIATAVSHFPSLPFMFPSSPPLHRPTKLIALPSAPDAPPHPLRHPYSHSPIHPLRHPNLARGDPARLCPRLQKRRLAAR
ncbi:hypothetical protein JOL62DRAFT_324607 [Phyllosticta paracitricarpa]|uniref:N-acetyltransferase domain-containing protein n=1 Tax=Phyllosticta paracitricarpa TaxID=2016321 RepID=A0ABR1MWR9_9PEZI